MPNKNMFSSRRKINTTNEVWYENVLDLVHHGVSILAACQGGMDV